MTWPVTWTPGHFEEVTAPLEKRRLLIPLEQQVKWVRGVPTLMTWRLKRIDGVPNFVGTSWVHAGPFLYLPNLFGFILNKFGYRIELYAGMRPSAVWPSGWADEGILGFIARWLKQQDWGNLGMALRIKKYAK